MSHVRPATGAGLPAVVELERRRFAEAGALLARAFAADPFWRSLLPDEERRARVLPWLFAHALGDLRGAIVERVGEPLAGVATWLPPSPEPPPAVLRTLAGAAVRLRRAFPGLIRYARDAARLEAEVGAAESWRLAGIGVEPSAQRRGHGSALLRAGLARADAAAQPVVLLTSNAANIGFYEGHGFAVAVERLLPAGGPPAWAMVRPARRR